MWKQSLQWLLNMIGRNFSSNIYTFSLIFWCGFFHKMLIEIISMLNYSAIVIIHIKVLWLIWNGVKRLLCCLYLLLCLDVWNSYIFTKKDILYVLKMWLSKLSSHVYNTIQNLDPFLKKCQNSKFIKERRMTSLALYAN